MPLFGARIHPKYINMPFAVLPDDCSQSSVFYKAPFVCFVIRTSTLGWGIATPTELPGVRTGFLYEWSNIFGSNWLTMMDSMHPRVEWCLPMVCCAHTMMG